MKNKLIYLILIITFVISPLLASADGVAIRPLPTGDWTGVDENSQQAFINYEQGTEKLIVAVDLEEESSNIAWIVPVPATPGKVGIDIISELPFFFGDDVISKAKLEFSANLKTSYEVGLLSQIWTFPFYLVSVSMGGARRGLGGGGKVVSGDLVSVETHIEKAGMVAEVITAKNGQAIYNYFSQKGFNIKEGSISELNSYIEKDYSFVVSWIAPEIGRKEKRGRGIFISFPTSKIYYPLILTSAYGETKIPITIRVLDHVKPEIFSEIKPYTEISYFTERTGLRLTSLKCKIYMAQFLSIMKTYYHHKNYYPSSLQELLEDKTLGGQAKTLREDIKKICGTLPSYLTKNSHEFTMRLRLPSGLYEINSYGYAGFVKKKELVSPELQKFYGDKKPWAGEADYTKITINSPAKLLKKDLWMEKDRPLKISFVLWSIRNSLMISYLLMVAMVSFIVGGLAGLLCFRKFKKYALVGLGNIFTLIGLILIFNYVKKKTKEDNKDSKFLDFVFSFSIIFVLVLTLLSTIILTILGSKIESELVGTSFISVCLGGGGIFLLDRFFMNKIENRAIRAILIILFIFCIGVSIFLFAFLSSLFL